MGCGGRSPEKGDEWGGGKWRGTLAYNMGRTIMEEDDKGAHSVLSSARRSSPCKNVRWRDSLPLHLPLPDIMHHRLHSLIQPCGLHNVGQDCGNGNVVVCCKFVQPRE